MLNPTRDTKTPLSSRIALSGALLLAGIFGLGTAILLPSKDFRIAHHARPSLSQEVEEPRGLILSREEEIALPEASTGDLVRFCAANVNETRSFVVFRTGSAVIVNEPCADPVAEACKKLAACSDPEVRFLTEPTREGELIVTFNEPVFHRFNGKDLTELVPWLENSAASLLTPSESAAVSEGWSPNRNARFGLLARRRMLEDAANPVPVRIIRAKSRAIAAN